MPLPPTADWFGTHRACAARSRIYRARAGNDLLSRVTLTPERPQFVLGQFAPEPIVAIEDLLRGENEVVEYKPFVRRGDAKEREFVETVVAFANGKGGTLLCGVDDHAVPQDLSAANKAFPNTPDPYGAAQRQLQKLITDQVRPVPPFDVVVEEVRGVRLVVAVVGSGREAPYQTREDKTFIRRGSTNVLAPANWDWSKPYRLRRS